MQKNAMMLQLALAQVRGRSPKDKSLEERLTVAMKFVRENVHQVFWMCSEADEDFQFRTAVAAVMLDGSQDDRDRIERSLRTLRTLNAMLEGVPVDLDRVDKDAGLPLLKLWQNSVKSNAVLERAGQK